MHSFEEVIERNRLSLLRVMEQDRQVAKRGTPSLPKLRFMEGLGPEDPKYDRREDRAKRKSPA